MSARHVIRIGAIVFISSIATIALPLLIPLGGLAKYLIAIALVAAIAGLSILLNGVIDLLRHRD